LPFQKVGEPGFVDIRRIADYLGSYGIPERVTEVRMYDLTPELDWCSGGSVGLIDVGQRERETSEEVPK
jgi:hypothetical protein